MSIFGDIANVVSDVASSVVDTASDLAQGAAGLASGPLGGLAMQALGVAFPPLGIATSLANMLTSGVGQAVTQAVNGLCKEAGLPKFLGEAIKDLVQNVVKDQCKPSTPSCDDAAGKQFGDGIKGLIDDLTKMIMDGAKGIMEQGEKGCKGGKGGKASAGSWLEAIAEAMGEAAGKKASQMVEFSNKLNDIQAGSTQESQQNAALEANKINSKFQASAQEFNMLQSAFSNAIKSIGEGIAQMARKG